MLLAEFTSAMNVLISKSFPAGFGKISVVATSLPSSFLDSSSRTLFVSDTAAGALSSLPISLTEDFLVFFFLAGLLERNLP